MQASIHLDTASAAMRAKRILESHGVRVRVQRTAQMSRQGGCGYRVIVPAYSPDMAMWLREAGVSILGIKGRGAP